MFTWYFFYGALCTKSSPAFYKLCSVLTGSFPGGITSPLYVCSFILWVSGRFAVPQRNAVRFNSLWWCVPRCCDKKVESIFMNVIDRNNNIYYVKYIFLLFSWSCGFLGHFSCFKNLWWCFCYTWWAFKIYYKKVLLWN